MDDLKEVAAMLCLCALLWLASETAIPDKAVTAVEAWLDG